MNLLLSEELQKPSDIISPEENEECTRHTKNYSKVRQLNLGPLAAEFQAKAFRFSSDHVRGFLSVSLGLSGK